MTAARSCTTKAHCRAKTTIPSLVALTQAKSQYEIASMHMTALQSAGKKQQLKSAEGQLTSAKGKYEGAAAQLAYSEIRSPIDGVVTDRPTYPGETPPPGTPLLTVMDTSSVIAKAHIPQDQAAQLKLGDAATMKAPGDIADQRQGHAGQSGTRSQQHHR